MIKGTLETLAGLIEADELNQVIRLIARVKSGDAPAGQWNYFDEDQQFKAIALTSGSLNDSVKEYHSVFSDIHILLEGSDTIYLGQEVIEVVEPYQKAADYSLVKATTSSVVTLLPGDFLVVEPEEIHCNVLAQNSCKLVVKIIKKWQK